MQHPSNKQGKINYRFGDVMRAGFSVAMVDGGFIIAIQVITFLLSYFATKFTSLSDISSFAQLSKANVLVSIISILNLSVIIFRITGLSRGIKYSASTCYQHALRRWPVLILLYILGSLLLIAVAMPLLSILQNIFKISLEDHRNLLIFLMLSLIPIGVFACIFVVDQGKNPLQAIIATFELIRHKISFNLLVNLSVLYTLPFSFGGLLATSAFAPYFGLFNAIWFLFCHVLTIVIYASTLIPNKDNEKVTQQKPTKVVII